MGSAHDGGYLFFVELPGLTTSGLFFLAVMAAFTMVCAMASANSWAAYDRQVLLIRTQETLASTDPLTGIPNRRAYLERVADAVDAAAWGHQTVVCLVDLDGFKAVNDAGGHAAGDAMLKAVGSALGGAVRETDTVARLGGDEFAVLADISVAFSGEMLAERLRDAVARIGRPSGVTASVGVAEVAARGRRRGPDAPRRRRDVPLQERRRQPRHRARLLSALRRPGAALRDAGAILATLRHDRRERRHGAESPSRASASASRRSSLTGARRTGGRRAVRRGMAFDQR